MSCSFDRYAYDNGTIPWCAAADVSYNARSEAFQFTFSTHNKYSTLIICFLFTFIASQTVNATPSQATISSVSHMCTVLFTCIEHFLVVPCAQSIVSFIHTF